MARKLFQSAELKNLDDSGQGSAIIATLNKVDRDGDITLPGAFGNQKVKLVGGHDWKGPNIGMASIKEVGDEVVADFKFYLNIPAAKDWYLAVKENFDNGVRQEYSYGYHPKKFEKKSEKGKTVRHLQEVDVFEVSFVMAGAGTDTRTLDIKSAKDEDGEQATKEDEDAESKSLHLEAFSNSWEQSQSGIRLAARKMFCPRTENGPAKYVSLMATFQQKAYISIESWDTGEPTVEYHELEWKRRKDGEVEITSDRNVKFDVRVTDAAALMKGLRLEVKEARTVRAEYRLAVAAARAEAKVGRILSRANRSRLSALAETLDELGRMRDTALDDIKALLDETDPERRKERARARAEAEAAAIDAAADLELSEIDAILAQAVM